jgi:hypothetical protein
MKHMKWIAVVATLVISGAALAQAPSPQTGKPAVTAVCKDGTPFSGDTMRGACRGHGGVDKDATSKAASQPAPAKDMGKAVPAPAPAAMPPKDTGKAAMPDTKTAPVAAGGGAGKVWANDTTKVYHCQGDRYYGKTKHGEYMTEAEAKTKGMRPDHGKECAAR